MKVYGKKIALNLLVTKLMWEKWEKKLEKMDSTLMHNKKLGKRYLIHILDVYFFLELFNVVL